MRKPQGVASLTLGYALHWAFSPPLLNPKHEHIKYMTDLPIASNPIVLNTSRGNFITP